MFSAGLLRELATTAPSPPVLSVYARTDPRDPANTAAQPAWRIEVSNGLSAVGERLERDGARDERLAFRDLARQVESTLTLLEPTERGRSVAVFVRPDGTIEHRLRLQLPVRATRVVWDDKPFVSALVDIADRGARTGVILVSGDAVRLLEVEQGEPGEPADSTFELELGDWRPYGGSAGGSPARGTHVTAHEERFEARVDAQREQLFETAAAAIGHRLGTLGWERIVLCRERAVGSRFSAALPDAARALIVDEVDRNLLHEAPHEVAAALEPVIEAAWLRRAAGFVESAHERAQAGGDATLGVDQTLAALAEGRVAQLVLDPAHPFETERIPAAIGGPPELLAERAVEAAIATAAGVTSLAGDVAPRLRAAGGMAALLRY
jgi:Bacterial archaeo-eukaryotic release factor family 10